MFSRSYLSRFLVVRSVVFKETWVDDQEVLLLIFCYMAYSSQQKPCNWVLLVSLCCLAGNLIANDRKEIPIFKELGSGHPLEVWPKRTKLQSQPKHHQHISTLLWKSCWLPLPTNLPIKLKFITLVISHLSIIRLFNITLQNQVASLPNCQ